MVKTINWRLAVIISAILLAAGLSWLNSSDGLLAGVLVGYLALAAFWLSRPEALALLWLALAPLGGYFLRYPDEQAVLTFDRITIALLALAVCRRIAHSKEQRLALGGLEWAWLLFALFALANSLLTGPLSLPSIKIAADSFLLPIILFIIVRHGLELTGRTRQLRQWLYALIALGYLLLPWGIYELLTGHDLLAYPGSELWHDSIIRPNGPYLADNSYALISLIVALALCYWPQAAGLTVTGRLRLLWRGAITSALIASLLPQFRAVALVLIASFALAHAIINGMRALLRPALALLLVAAAALPVWLLLSNTDFYQRRIADPSNISSRLVTYRIASQVVRDNWLWGVGLGRYQEYFQQHYAPREAPTTKKERKRAPQSTPHNDLLTVAAELGIGGLILYLAALLLLALPGWRWARQPDRRRAAGAAILAMLLAYTGVGLTLTSGYYSDLNLIFFFLLGLCYWTADRQERDLSNHTTS